jgi:hypothetical protein
MAAFMNRQPSSRLGTPQVTNLTSASVSAAGAAAFGPQTYQVRAVTTLSGWLVIGDGVQTAAEGAGVYLPANAAPEYFTVSPGQSYAFLTTSTATGYLSLAEME